MKTKRLILGGSVALICTAVFLVVSPLQKTNAAGGIRSIGNCTTIDKPGSYVLANNIEAGPRDGNCIEVLSDNVTLDLSGYTISGAGATGNGVFSVVTRGVTVRNGSVRDFGQVGVFLQGEGHKVEDMWVFNNGNEGISLRFMGMVRHNTVFQNRGDGIRAGEGSSVVGNIVSRNTGSGISASCPSLVLQNSAYQDEINAHFNPNQQDACTVLENSPPQSNLP